MSAAKRGLGVAPWTFDLSGVHGCRWNLPAAQRYCRSMVKDRDENLAHWLGLFCAVSRTLWRRCIRSVASPTIWPTSLILPLAGSC